MQHLKQEMQGRQMRGTRQTTQKKNKNENGVNQRIDYQVEPVINIQTSTSTVERLTPKSPMRQRQTPSNNSKGSKIIIKPQLEVRIDESLVDQPFLPYNNNGPGTRTSAITKSIEPPKVPNYTENEKQIKQKYHMLGKLRNFRNNSNLNIRRNSKNAQMQIDLIYRNTSSKNYSFNKQVQKKNVQIFDKKRVSNPAPQQNDPRSVYGGLTLNFGPQVNSVKNININNLIQSHNIIQQEMMLQRSQENLHIKKSVEQQQFIAESKESPSLAAKRIIENSKIGSPYKLEKIYSNRQALTTFSAQKPGQYQFLNRRGTTIASSRSPLRSTSRPRTGRSVQKMNDEQQAKLGQILNFGVKASNYFEQRHFSIVQNASSHKSFTPFNKNQNKIKMPTIVANGPPENKSRNAVMKKSLNTFNVGPLDQKRHKEYGKKITLNNEKVSNQITDALASQLEHRSNNHLKVKVDQKKNSVSTINNDAKIQLNLSNKSKNVPKPSIKSLKSLQPTISTESELELKDIASQEYGNIQQKHRNYKIIDPQTQKTITLKQNTAKVSNQPRKQNNQIKQQVQKKISNKSSLERGRNEPWHPNPQPQKPKFIRKQSHTRPTVTKPTQNLTDTGQEQQEMTELDIKRIVKETIQAQRSLESKQSSLEKMEMDSLRKNSCRDLSIDIDTLKQIEEQEQTKSLDVKQTVDSYEKLQKFEEYKIPEIKVNPKRYSQPSPEETNEPTEQSQPIPSEIEQIEKLLKIEDEKLILRESLEKINRTLQQTDAELQRISKQKEKILTTLDLENKSSRDSKKKQQQDLKTLQVNEDEDSELILKQQTLSKKESTFVKLKDTAQSNLLRLAVKDNSLEASNVGSESKQVTKEIIKLDEVNRAVSFGVNNQQYLNTIDGSHKTDQKEDDDQDKIKMQKIINDFEGQNVFEVKNYNFQVETSAEFKAIKIQSNSSIKDQGSSSKKQSMSIADRNSIAESIQLEFQPSPVIQHSKVYQFIQNQLIEDQQHVFEDHQEYASSPRIKEPGLPGLRESRRTTHYEAAQNLAQQDALKDDSILISDNTNEKKMSSVEKDYGIQDFYGALENPQMIGNISMYEESFPQTDSVEDISQTIKIANDIKDNGQDEDNEEDSLNGGQFQDVESQESLVNIGDQKHLDDLDALKIEQQGLKTTKITMDLEQIQIQIIAEDYIEDLFRNVNSSLEFDKLDIIPIQRYSNRGQGMGEIQIQENNLKDTQETKQVVVTAQKSESNYGMRESKNICLADLTHAQILTSKTPVNRGEQMILQINQNLGHLKMRNFCQNKAQIVLTPQNVEQAYHQFTEHESSINYSQEAQNKEQSVVIAQSSTSSKKGQQYLDYPFYSSKYTDNFESLNQVQSGINTQSVKAFKNLNSCPKTDVIVSQKEESSKSFSSVIEKSIVEEELSSSDSVQMPHLQIGKPTIVIPSSTPKNNEHQNTITPTGADSIQDFMDLHKSLCNYFKGTPLNASYIRLVLHLILDSKLGHKDHRLDDEIIKENKSKIDEQLKDLQKKLWMFITCTKLMNQNLADPHLRAAQESFRDDIDETCHKIYLILFEQPKKEDSQISESSSSVEGSKLPVPFSLNVQRSSCNQADSPQKSDRSGNKSEQSDSNSQVKDLIQKTEKFLEDTNLEEQEQDSYYSSSFTESEVLAFKMGKECDEVMEQRRQSNIKNIMIEQRKKHSPQLEIPGGNPNSDRINKAQGMIRHMKQRYGL